MQTTSADYKTAIAATDREIRGYLKFNNSFVMRGSDGLISFKTTQNAMDGERYCLGSVTSAYCEASFFNSALDGSGVSLANSYFDAYIGVCTGELPDADVDYVTETLSATINYTFASGTYLAMPQTGMKTQLQALKDGDEIVFAISNVDYVGTWDATLHKASVTDGTLTYTLFYDGYALAKLSINDANDDPVYGTYKIGLTARVYKVEYVCCGRYWVSEITRTAKTTNIAGYDVAGRLSMDYVCTVTPDPDDGFLVMDVLNDIIDQTGVNNGVHFSTFGDSTYVPNLVEGNCKSQWGWLCTIAGNDNANEYTGKRDPADLGYVGTYYAGNNASAYSITDDTLYMDGFNAGDEFTITSLTTGTKENPIVVGNGFGINSANPYIDNAKAASIENTVDSYQYYPVTMKWRGDPCLDVMDELSVTHDGVTYKTLCMKIVTTFNGGLQQDITAWADSEAFYALSTSPMETKIQTVSNLVSEIAQAIETADGGVITKILDTDGTWKELVIANNQDLSQATSVWRFNINGLAHSDRYQGGTYTLAMDTQGRIIANVIQTGILQDANGYNSWNLDTGALTITDGSINITTSNESEDLIQFNGDSRNAQGYGSTFYSQMTPTSHLVHRDNYTPATHSATTVSVNAGSVMPLYVKEDTYSNVQPEEIYGTTRGVLTGTSVDFYQAVGIGAEEELVSSIPNGVDFGDDVTPYSSRCTITYKICKKFGHFRFIRLLLSSSHTGSNSPRLASVGAGNAPQFANALTCVTYVSDSDVGTAVPCMIGTSGGIYLKSTSSGTNYLVTGYYCISS